MRRVGRYANRGRERALPTVARKKARSSHPIEELGLKVGVPMVVVRVEAMADDRGAAEDETRIPLSEETARVEKRRVSSGKVVIRTVVDETNQLIRETLAADRVHVTHVPVNREVQVVPEIRTEGDVTIIPIVEEIVVVEKRLVLKEELHVRRRSTAQAIEVPVTLRRQRAVIDRTTLDSTNQHEE